MKLSWDALDSGWERLDRVVDAALTEGEAESKPDHPVWWVLELCPEGVIITLRAGTTLVGYVIGRLL